MALTDHTMVPSSYSFGDDDTGNQPNNNKRETYGKCYRYYNTGIIVISGVCNIHSREAMVCKQDYQAISALY